MSNGATGLASSDAAVYGNYLSHLIRSAPTTKPFKIKIGPGAASRWPIRCGKKLSVREAAQKAEEAIGELLRIAEGEQTHWAERDFAAHELSRVSHGMVMELNRLAKKCPALYAQFANLRSGWPVLYGLHPGLIQAAKKTIQSLGVGKAGLIRSDAAARANIRLEVYAQVAEQLLRYTQDQSRLMLVMNPDHPLAKLPKFTKDTAGQWWGAAKDFFLQAYPRPEEITFLSDKVTGVHTDTLARKRHRILEFLKRRFQSLAPKS